MKNGCSLQQKELEKARQGKWKVMEESGDEMDREPEGSDKKVSSNDFFLSVNNQLNLYR